MNKSMKAKKVAVILLLIGIGIFLVCCTKSPSADSTLAQPATSISTALVDDLSVGMDIEQVISILGYPEADVGSGISVHRYTLSDGNVLLISYENMPDGIPCVSHFCVVEDKEQ